MQEVGDRRPWCLPPVRRRAAQRSRRAGPRARRWRRADRSEHVRGPAALWLPGVAITTAQPRKPAQRQLCSRKREHQEGAVTQVVDRNQTDGLADQAQHQYESGKHDPDRTRPADVAHEESTEPVSGVRRQAARPAEVERSPDPRARPRRPATSTSAAVESTVAARLPQEGSRCHRPTAYAANSESHAFFIAPHSRTAMPMTCPASTAGRPAACAFLVSCPGPHRSLLRNARIHISADMAPVGGTLTALSHGGRAAWSQLVDLLS